MLSCLCAVTLCLLVAGVLSEGICANAALGGENCQSVWFSCVNQGVPLVAGLGIQWGTPCPGRAWSVSYPGWQATHLEPKRAADFYRFGDPATPLGDAEGASLGQGMWACTLDNTFNYLPRSDYGTNTFESFYDLWGGLMINRTENPPPRLYTWPLEATGYRTQGSNVSVNTLVSHIPMTRVPTLGGPAAGVSEDSLTSLMRPLTFAPTPSKAATSTGIACYVSTFNPCQQNGCPAGQVRIRSPSVCCPLGDVVVGDGSAPPLCCPKESDGDPEKPCCQPDDKIFDGKCCSPDRVNDDSSSCCAKPSLSGNTWRHTLLPTENHCCPSRQVNDLGFCCPTQPPVNSAHYVSTPGYNGVGGTDCCPSDYVRDKKGVKYCTFGVGGVESGAAAAAVAVGALLVVAALL